MSAQVAMWAPENSPTLVQSCQFGRLRQEAPPHSWPGPEAERRRAKIGKAAVPLGEGRDLGRTLGSAAFRFGRRRDADRGGPLERSTTESAATHPRWRGSQTCKG